jgi:hypothetical protein
VWIKYIGYCEKKLSLLLSDLSVFIINWLYSETNLTLLNYYHYYHYYYHYHYHYYYVIIILMNENIIKLIKIIQLYIYL